MKKLTTATAGSIGLSIIALAVVPVQAGSKNHEQVADLDVDIVAAATIASDSTDARIIEAEFESKRGKAIWELELIDVQNREIEVKVDANTGEIVSKEIEGKFKNRSMVELDDSLSMAEAINIVNVVASGEVVEAELGTKDGDLIWELKVVGEDKTKYRVDASTGALLP